MGKVKQDKGKTVAYLRVSTVDQDTEKNKADVLHFANDRRFRPCGLCCLKQQAARSLGRTGR